MSDATLFTVGVFQDAAAAARGVAALVAERFAPEAVSILALESADPLPVAALLDAEPARMVAKGLGAVRARGSLVATLQGEDDGLTVRGLAATAGRAGFQTHDGRIFEALTARGGVLVAVEGAARAADALAILHAYGGGNAAIGAWAGRL